MLNEQALAVELADLAASTSLPRFRSGGYATRIKPDGSPVTEVDIAVEAALRNRIAKQRPATGSSERRRASRATQCGAGIWI